MAHRRGTQAAFERRGEVLDDDDGLGARIPELMLELACGVQRVDVDHHQAGTQHRRHGDRILRHVGHHQRHAIAFAQTQALQVGTERLALRVDFPEGHVSTHVAVGDTVAETLETFRHQLHQRAVLRGIDLDGYAGRVGIEPGAAAHVGYS